MTNPPGDEPQDHPDGDPTAPIPQPPEGAREQGPTSEQGWQPQYPGQGQYAGPGAPGYPPPPGGYAPPPQGAYAYQAPEHPKATTSMILGIVGMVVCQVLGPFAWVMGKRTLDEIDASNGTLGGRGQAQAGYILGIIATILLGLSLLVLVAYLLFALALVGGAVTSG